MDTDTIYSILTTALSIGATIASVLLFISPLKEVQKTFSLRTSRGQSPLPFVFMWANCCLWALYGMQMSMIVLMIVNSIGLVLSIYYTIVFFFVANRAERVQLTFYCLSASVLVIWAFLYTEHYVGPFIAINLLPWVATCVCMIMFGSPLVVAVSNFFDFI